MPESQSPLRPIYASDMALANRLPRRVQYRVGLGGTVSLLVAGAIGLVTWASLGNTRAAIVDENDQQVRGLLAELDLDVRDQLQDAVAAVSLSESLMSKAVLRDDPDLLARHFTEV